MPQKGHFPARELSRKELRLGILLTLSAGIAFFLAPTFDAFFMADDFGWLSFARGHSSWLEAAREPSLGDWTTPASNVLFWFLYRWFGLHSTGYYAVIGLIHLLNGWLVYELAIRLMDRPFVAGGAALLYSLHFIHYSDWGPLVWISAFVQVLVASFYLLALILYLDAIHLGRRSAYVGSIATFSLALASKEMALTLPAVLLAWHGLVQPPGERDWKQIGRSLTPYLAIAALYLGYKFLFQRTSDRYIETGMYGLGIHWITNWKYLANLVMPNPHSPPVQSFMQTNLPAWTMATAGWLAVVVRFSMVASAIAILWLGDPSARFLTGFILITHLPFVGFVGGLSGAHRYFYLPAVGFSILAAFGLGWLTRRMKERFGRTNRLILAALVLGLGMYLLIPSRVWQTRMAGKGQLRRELIRAIERGIGRETTAIEEIHLAGFPEEDARDLEVMGEMVFGLQVSRSAPGALAERHASPGVLVLSYGDGEIHAVEKNEGSQ